MSWKNYIIILISFGIGFIIGWHPSTESVRLFVISTIVPFALTGGGIAVVFKLMDWIEKQNTTKATNKLNYSRKLVETVLKPRITTDIDFYSNYEPTLRIKVIGLPTTPEYKRYSNDADACLNRYAEVQKIIKDRDNLIEKHNVNSQIFIDKFISDILIDINQIIPNEYNAFNQTESKRYFNKYNIQLDLSKAIRSAYTTHNNIILSNHGNILIYRDGNRHSSIFQ